MARPPRKSDDPSINLICGLVPHPEVDADPEAYLLDAAAYEAALWDMVDASFPLRWAPARVALLSDHRARVILLGRELGEGSLRALAEAQSTDGLLELLERSLEHLPAELVEEVQEELKKW
jgi:hypothetical protein